MSLLINDNSNSADDF